METRSALFREIHKNTWLKRLTADGKKVTVGVKKSERSWVVFCVHDDTEALLEGYTEPRMAPSHTPEWIISLHGTQHISHALVPNEQEYEFVITLNNEVVRFHAMSWETMQEWVDTLRSKLREMKILSPKENLYTKLPEARVPLLPTRDPTSPLPATPPVPAAIVPGVECVVPSTNAVSPLLPVTSSDSSANTRNTSIPIITTYTSFPSTITTTTTTVATTTSIPSLLSIQNPTASVAPSSSTSSIIPSTSSTNSSSITNVSSMSNTLTQNLLNMLTDPISNYSVQVNEAEFDDEIEENGDIVLPTVTRILNRNELPSLARTFTRNVLGDTTNSNLISLKSNFLSNINNENSIRVDVGTSRYSPGANSSSEPSSPVNIPSESMINPRQKAHRSVSLNEVPINRTISSNNNITELDVQNNITESQLESTTNITIIQVSNPLPINNTPEVFKFPPPENIKIEDDYKSNVQIIPSTISAIPITVSNQYSSPIKNKIIENPSNDNNQVTKVHVSGTTTNLGGNSYGKICPTTPSKVLKKLILSASTSGVTNISVNNDNVNNHSIVSTTAAIVPSAGSTNVASGAIATTAAATTSIATTSTATSTHYEKVFLTSSIPILSTTSSNLSPSLAPRSATNSNRSISSQILPNVNRLRNKNSSTEINRNIANKKLIPSTSGGSFSAATAAISPPGPLPQSSSSSTSSLPSLATEHRKSPAPLRKKNTISEIGRENMPPASMNIRPVLTRGLTEAVITTRPSRIDVKKPRGSRGSNNNSEGHNAVDRTRSESLEQRRRSSSTSDAQSPRQRQRGEGEGRPRAQQPPSQPFRLAQECSFVQGSKRLTLREQQVMQLRREIMHPGGVRLQLRRKDCVASIAWVDAFGAVWVSGWKQKDHPMLYNALHIGDQLISIAGVAISSATEANKIIRNTNTLFLEILIRRIPFGRVYAIRRELEGQCLGLIRDGNTATIVDVVPNSLAARHGLPPKAKSCDGLSLTFWVLTEINGRPLNLFFKETEVRDRLNSVGRDISILVQPLDLITKLKKQLKSLRSYKDYIVQ